MAGCRGMGLSRKAQAPSRAWFIAKETFSRWASDKAQLPPNGTEGCATEVAQTKEDRGRRRKRGGERSRKREGKREYGKKKKKEEEKKKNVIQRARIHRDLSYIDPQARVLKYFSVKVIKAIIIIKMVR